MRLRLDDIVDQRLQGPAFRHGFQAGDFVVVERLKAVRQIGLRRRIVRKCLQVPRGDFTRRRIVDMDASRLADANP